MTPRRWIQILLTILLSAAGARGAQRDSLIVSLVTCWPGPEIYELCGHEALRIRSASMDSVWNYGLFDFNQPGFVYRFVKGETDYMLGGYPFSWFLPEYRQQKRHVEEQELNLSQQEAHQLLAMLREESRPENCVYRYNYVYDNCATRITDRLDAVSGSRIIYPDSIRYGTFRREMRNYHREYPWYQFGIDLCLGSGIDHSITARNEMFVPVEMHRASASAHFADGRPLVRATRVLNEGIPDPTLGPTPWWATPLCLFWTIFALALVTIWIQARKQRIFPWVYSIWFGLTGLTGCLLAFLVFISTHEATSPNLLILWINPLQLIIALGVWWKSWRNPVRIMGALNTLLILILLIVWPWQGQSANPAFLPMAFTSLLLSAQLAILASKRSYNNNEEVSNLGAGRSRSRRNPAGKRRPATSRGGHRR